MSKFNPVSGLYDDDEREAPYIYNAGAGKFSGLGADDVPAMQQAALVKPNKLLLYGVLAALAVVLYPQLKRGLKQIVR